MKNMKRILLTVVAAMLLVVMSVAGTLAYLTSTSQEVKNTFTVGDVNIILDEAQVTGDGQNWATNHDNRVLENSYKLQPGLTYKKDPTVTVVTGSEDCYVRMLVTVNDYSKLQSAFPDAEWWDGDLFLLEKLVLGWDRATWIPQAVTVKSKDDTSVTYEFWYKEEVTANTTDNNANIAGIQLPDLFTDIKMPDNMTNTELAFLQDMKINVIAHAIQSEGLTMEKAWEAWGATGADNIMAPTQPAAGND